MSVQRYRAGQPATPAGQSRGRPLQRDNQKPSNNRSVSSSSSSSASSTGRTQASTPPPLEGPPIFPMTPHRAWQLVYAICSRTNTSTAGQTLAVAAKATRRLPGIPLDQVANLLLTDAAFTTANFASGCHWKISTFRLVEGQLIGTDPRGCEHAATSTSQAPVQSNQ